MGYLLAIAICIVAFIVWQVAPFVLQSLRSPLKQLPGPPSAHWFFGNFKVIWEKEDSRAQEKWVEEYGPTIAYQGLFGVGFFTLSLSILSS